MRRLALAPLLALLALLVLATTAACGIADFDVEQDIPEQRIDGNPLGGLLGGFFQVPLQLDIKAKIDAMDTGPVDSVTLSSLVLDIQANAAQSCPGTADWGFVDTVDLFVESTKSGTNLARVKIAGAANPPATQRLEFDPVAPKVNLLGYVNEGARITAEASGTAPTTNVCFVGNAVFRVNPL